MNTAPATMAQPQPMTVEQVINMVWRAHSQAMDLAGSQRLEVPITLKDVIGDEGIATIATRLQDVIDAPVTTVEDVDGGVIQIAPSRYLLGHNSIVPGAKKPKVKTLKEDKVARPPNAFILYRQHHHPLVKASHPELHNNQISVILGTQWKDETESTKARYVGLAKKLKIKHFLEHPNYQYQPRKPSEKKRRMTRRKAAAQAESEQANSSSSADTTSVLGETSSSVEKSNAIVHDLPKTQGGKTVLELGDETLDDEDFAAMLEKYNKSIPPATTQVAIAARNPRISPAVYDEPSEVAQSDYNFYSSVLDYNPFAGGEELDETMQGMPTGEEGFEAMMASLEYNTGGTTFDEQNESIINAELDRTNRLGEWCTVFDGMEMKK